MKPFRKFLIAEIALVCIACAVAVVAIAANQQWFDRHFLPAFFISHAEYVRMELAVRAAAVAVGAGVALFARRPLARLLITRPATVVNAALAIVLSFGASEMILRRVHVRAAEEVPAGKEPLRSLDARFGWLFVPSHIGYQSNNGRRVQYVMDGNGYRVRRLEEPVDFDRPSIIFTGESMMVGEKLLWRETIPARTSAFLGIQSANIAVSGFATDQAYLRLTTELPRFRRPLAVVMLFTPTIFDRNLDDDRPHLGPGLVWAPAAGGWRLVALARRVIRYRTEERVERGIETTREVLRATIRLAQSRGAVPVIVVPQFGAEETRERELRQRILDAGGIPYLRVELDRRWRIADDGHPDARAAERIAAAIAQRLRTLAGTNYAKANLHETPAVRQPGPLGAGPAGLPAYTSSPSEFSSNAID